MSFVALEETTILYLNKDIFMEVIEPKDMKIIKDTIQPIDVEKIALSILSIKNSTKLKVRTSLANKNCRMMLSWMQLR